MCIADANYRIIYSSYGHYGSNSDGGIFDRSELKKKLDSGSLNIPQPAPLVGTDQIIPFFFLADAAFPLLPNLMKPYAGDVLDKNRRVYNYRFYFLNFFSSLGDFYFTGTAEEGE